MYPKINVLHCKCRKFDITNWVESCNLRSLCIYNKNLSRTRGKDRQFNSVLPMCQRSDWRYTHSDHYDSSIFVVFICHCH